MESDWVWSEEGTYVPHCEGDVFVFHRLHVETDGGDRGHDFSQLQFV